MVSFCPVISEERSFVKVNRRRTEGDEKSSHGHVDQVNSNEKSKGPVLWLNKKRKDESSATIIITSKLFSYKWLHIEIKLMVTVRKHMNNAITRHAFSFLFDCPFKCIIMSDRTWKHWSASWFFTLNISSSIPISLIMLLLNFMKKYTLMQNI